MRKRRSSNPARATRTPSPPHPTSQELSLTRVRLHVLVEVLLHVEVLAAPLAHELLVPDVDAHVGAQLVLVLEALVAVLQGEDEQTMSTSNTPVSRPTSAQSPVCGSGTKIIFFPPKIIQKNVFPGKGPYLAFERLLPRVLQRMDLEGHAALEGLPTGLAGEGHVLGVSWSRGEQRHAPTPHIHLQQSQDPQIPQSPNHGQPKNILRRCTAAPCHP